MIIMTLIVRNEGDIVAANLEHHLGQGVDKIIALDNGSTDGTIEILHSYVKAGVLDLECVGDIPFDKIVWANRQIQCALSQYKPTWIISNDADEFYYGPEGQTLKNVLDAHLQHRILSCSRRNWVGASDELGRDHWTHVLRYKSNLDLAPPARIFDPMVRLDFPFFYYALPAKVVFQPVGFSGLALGAHAVDLEANPTPVECPIEIHHYPVRNLDEFIASVYRFCEFADKFPNLPARSAKYRRWGQMLRNGVGLERVIAEAIPDSARIIQDLGSGLLEENIGAKGQNVEQEFRNQEPAKSEST